MALLKMGSLVTQISGKIGGQTFGTGQGGQYVKNTGSYVNKLTTSRTVVNSRLSYLANSWRALTTAQKNSWSAAATNFPYVNRLGESKVYSGYNLYMKFNGNRLLWGDSPVSTAPVPFVFSEFALSIDTLEPGFMEVSITPTTTGYEYLFFVSNPSSAGSNFNQKGLRLVKAVTGVTAASTPVDLYSEYEAIFGAIKSGTRFFFRVYQYEKATGIKSGYYQDISYVAD